MAYLHKIWAGLMENAKGQLNTPVLVTTKICSSEPWLNGQEARKATRMLERDP